MDDVVSPLSNRPSSGRSIKIKEKITTPKRRRKFVSSGESPNIQNVVRICVCVVCVCEREREGTFRRSQLTNIRPIMKRTSRLPLPKIFTYK